MSNEHWKSNPNAVLEEQRRQLYERYHAVQGIQSLANSQMDKIKEELDINGHSARSDAIEQLNNSFGLSLRIGQTYLITEDHMPKYDKGNLGFPQPVVCSYIHYFDTVLFHGKWGRHISISAAKLCEFELIPLNATIEDVSTKYGYASYPCFVCKEYEPIQEMTVIDKNLVCSCEASEDEQAQPDSD